MYFRVSFPSTTTKDSTGSGVEESLSSRSGWLPNIAQNFGYYKNLAINSIQRKDFKGARSALYNLNTSLGTEYLVNISTAQFEEAMKEQLMFQCSECTQTEKRIINEGEDDEYTKEIQVPSEIPDKDVKVFDKILPLIASVIQDSKTKRIWVCPKCHKENNMSTTAKILSEREKPYYLKVIPDPPVIQKGLDRLFPHTFENWFYNFLEEITAQEVLYRKEYVSQHGEDMPTFSDKGDKA